MNNSELIILKDYNWLKRQKHAGKCIFNIFNQLNDYLKQDNISLIDIENFCLPIIKQYECTPTFLNYRGFPSSICTSVNNQLVHGIVTDYVLQSGDLITIDFGTTFEGAIADAARTWIYKEPKSIQHTRLVETTRIALQKGLEAVKIGNRIGAIGNAISKYIKNTGFGLITEYGGHGINYNKPHASPFIFNKASSNDGVMIEVGLSIAIEPMVVIGEAKTFMPGADRWTVRTPGIGCHFEDSVTMWEDGLHNITGEE